LKENNSKQHFQQRRKRIKEEMNNRLEMGTRGYPRDEERCIRMTFVTHDAYVDPIFRKI